jgi:hypothetical protein
MLFLTTNKKNYLKISLPNSIASSKYQVKNSKIHKINKKIKENPTKKRKKIKFSLNISDLKTIK